MSLEELSRLVLLPVLSLSILIAFVRLLLGPRVYDRVVALDLLSTLGIGIIAVHSVTTSQPMFLDVTVVLALVSFLGTVAFAYYLKRGPAR